MLWDYFKKKFMGRYSIKDIVNFLAFLILLTCFTLSLYFIQEIEAILGDLQLEIEVLREINPYLEDTIYEQKREVEGLKALLKSKNVFIDPKNLGILKDFVAGNLVFLVAWYIWTHI